jgi:hypothetical protein
MLISGVLVSLGTVLTGVFDGWQSSEAGAQPLRTINANALIMVCVTLIVLTDLGLRWLRYHPASSSPQLPWVSAWPPPCS